MTFYEIVNFVFLKYFICPTPNAAPGPIGGAKLEQATKETVLKGKDYGKSKNKPK